MLACSGLQVTTQAVPKKEYTLAQPKCMVKCVLFFGTTCHLHEGALNKKEREGREEGPRDGTCSRAHGARGTLGDYVSDDAIVG